MSDISNELPITTGCLMRQLWRLYKLFFKIGLFTFGGGYAMLPLLQDELVRKRKWLSEEELLDLYSIGQCTPGIISINVATFVGYQQAGIRGAVFTTMGMITPSILIITLIAAVLYKYMYNRYVTYAFDGIRVCVVALILDILYGLWKKNVTDKKAAVIFAGALGLLAVFNLSAVILVILAGAVGWFWHGKVKQ